MTMLPRHPLLPDPERSRAVLVASGVPIEPYSFDPETMARDLAEALTTAFTAGHTQVPANPAEMCDAVRLAAEAASDTLLFYYVGNGSTSAGPDNAEHLKAVAEVMSTTTASRPVVILDGACVPGKHHDGEEWFRELSPTSFVLAGSSFGPPGDQLVPFTPTLVDALRYGVLDGPELLDLLTLRNAVEASFHAKRYFIEDDWVMGPASLTVHHPPRFPMVALGANPSFGTKHRGALLRDAAVVDERYG